jgi:prophage DNA circulation protein
MTWRDQLLPASFRGVKFHYEELRKSGGRRRVDDEYPYRDDVYIEDIGRRKREHRITGYVLGDDFLVQRDALEAALEQPGPGTLVHPTRGPLSVKVGAYSVSERLTAEGRMARFEFDCVEDGGDPSPVPGSDTRGKAAKKSVAALTAAQSSFLKKWLVLAGTTVNAATGLLNNLEATLAQLKNWPNLILDQVSPLIKDLASDVNNAVALAQGLTNFFSGYADAVLASIAPFDAAFSSRGPILPTDISFGLSSIAAWGDALGAAPSPDAQINQDALAALVKGSAAAALVQIFAATDFAAEDDADAARDTVASLTGALLQTAADFADDLAATAWNELATAAIQDLSDRAKQAPATATYVFGSTQPAVVLAQRLYGDAARAGELVARNAAPHPLFLPPQVRALIA